MDESKSKYHTKGQEHNGAKRSPRGRRFLRPRLVAVVVVVVAVGLNASGAFGLNGLGLHSALTATSLPTGFQSAALANYGALTPTQTTCSSFSTGNSGTINTIQYSTKLSGKPPAPVISQVNPGVFFYWVPITSTGTGDVFTLVETASNPPTPKNFFTEASGTGVFTNPACTAVSGESISKGAIATTSAGCQGLTPPCYVVTVTKVPAGAYFVGLKYSTSNVVGDAPPSNPPGAGTALYSFGTYVNGNFVSGSAPGNLSLSHK